ncbi:MAG: S9 family peptidase [Planctomycetia bacterium]|nr:S9 family peptidase [Planctomycetia bacterium]
MIAMVLVLVAAQGTPSDFERSRTLYARTSGKVVGGSVEPHWYADGKFWFRDGKGATILVDPVARTRKTVDKDKLPTGATSTSKKGREGVQQRQSHAPRGEASPDGKHRVTVEKGDLRLDGKTIARGAMPQEYYEGGVFWSPDSTKFIALRTRAGRRRVVNLIESSPKNGIDPILHTFRYDKPGDELDVTTPRLFHATTGKEITLDPTLYPDPWSIDEFRWGTDSQTFTFAYNRRGHQVLRIIEADAATGKTRAVIDEVSKTFIDYAGKRFVWYMPDSILWMSERDGWNHLYRIDRKTGTATQLTKGDWVVRGVDRVDETNRLVYFRAGGIDSKQSPYHVHYCRVAFDGNQLTHLTAGDGSHLLRRSPKGQYLVDTYSRVDSPPVSVLRDADGKHLMDLDKADITLLTATGWQMPERFVAKGRDGRTDIWGVIYRPTTFDPKKRYPVLEYIYAGPHSAFVPQTFAAFRYEQEMAELGFIVVQIDGMGTSHRSKTFHDVCWKNLGDSGFPDRIAWMKAAAKDRPWMDLTRVGIWGGSAGGQSSLRAMLAHGDFYKAAVADCGCHDNRVDKVWWNELWMGWPIGPHYQEQSNVTNAHRLSGKLMLVVGEMDRNVDPASTLQVVNALVKADKDFDLVFLPGTGHGAAESPYGRRRRAEFFVKVLIHSSR